MMEWNYYVGRPRSSYVSEICGISKLMNVYLNHFPKHEKYALANRIRNTAYEVYELIMEGQKRYFKKQP